MSSTTIILLVLAAIVLPGIMMYNRLVALRQRRGNAFADIDVQLKLRYDLVPNLVESVKGYATHERQLLENVTAARAKAMNTGGTGAERAVAEGAFGAAITQLLAVAENYPDLKANTNFLQLQSELSDIENKIAAARRFFNNATNEYNTAVEQFPAVLIANMFHFQKEAFFDVGEERKKLDEPVRVSFN